MSPNSLAFVFIQATLRWCVAIGGLLHFPETSNSGTTHAPAYLLPLRIRRTQRAGASGYVRTPGYTSPPTCCSASAYTPQGHRGVKQVENHLSHVGNAGPGGEPVHPEAVDAVQEVRHLRVVEERIRTAAQGGCKRFEPSRDRSGIPGRGFVRCRSAADGSTRRPDHPAASVERPYLRIRANVFALSITSTTFRLKARSLRCGEPVTNREYMSNRHRASMSSGSFATRVCSIDPSVL